MSKKKNLYLGKAGQFLVMSELLCRGWNVATPEVDVGDDIFVARDANGDLVRVQVKTGTGKQGKRAMTGVSVQFNVNLTQLERATPPKLVYAFVVRCNGLWQRLIIIEQNTLLEQYQVNRVGSVSGNNLVLRFRLKNNELRCARENFSIYLSNFEDFPLIEH